MYFNAIFGPLDCILMVQLFPLAFIFIYVFIDMFIYKLHVFLFNSTTSKTNMLFFS